MKPIKEVVEEVMAGLKKGPERLKKIEKVLAETLGEARRYTRPVSLKKGCLTINVSSSAGLYQLNLKKQDILKRLKGCFKEIEKINLRIGEIR